jgi:RNA polymerase sigma factor (sigma-70 family)
MSDAAKGPILRYIRNIGVQASASGVSDRELLSRFVTQHDEAAFELLLWRYGAMVLHVCRGVTHDAHDAEDAFQATFLVLARKARSVRKREALGGWLYRVAYHLALKARGQKVRRAAHEKHGLDLHELPGSGPTSAAETADELRPVLLEEVNRLPAKYRTPVILCYLEGKTHDEAARHLGWPKGTVSGRLARAREMLRTRLVRRGLSISAGALTAVLSPGDTSAMQPLLRRTMQTAVGFTADGANRVGPVSGRVALLVEGMLRTMFLTKLRVIVTGVSALVFLGSGAGLVANHVLATKQAAAETAPPDPAPPEQSLAPAIARDHDANSASKPLTAEEQFRALVKEFDAGSQHVSWRDKYEKRVLELAQANPTKSFAVDALLWTLQRGWQPNGGILLATTQPFGESAGKALELLAKDYVEDKRVGVIVEYLALAPPAADQFLLAVMQKNPDRTLQARACLSLASRCRWLAELAHFNLTLPRLASTEEEAKQLARMAATYRDEEKDRYRQAEKYFRLASERYGDVPRGDQWTIGEYARGSLFELRNLVVGKTAPEIEGEDINGAKFKLSDYRGKVVLLNFYWWGNEPRRSIQAFERSLAKKFEGRPFAMLGVGRDQDREVLKRARTEEHITWRSWFDRAGSSGAVGRRWLDGGMIPGPIAVRWNVGIWPTLYLLDHKGVIRDKNLGLRDMEGLVERLVQEAEADVKSSPGSPSRGGSR